MPPIGEMIIILDKRSVIEQYLHHIGRSVILIKNGKPTEVCAVIEQTWKRNKSRFEKSNSEIGRYFQGYYIYYGPASFDITSLSDEDTVEIDGESYYFVQSESVKAGNIIQYYRGVLKKAYGEEGYELLQNEQ